MKLDDYQQWRPASTCLTAERPGVQAFRAWVLARYGGEDLGIMRACGDSGPDSLHHEGRAWDWGIVRVPAEPAQLVTWLLADGPDGSPHYWARRFGIVTIIYARKIWSTTNVLHRQIADGWRAYGGASPHTTHVHFGFADAGADAETTGYEWQGNRAMVSQEASPELGNPTPAPPSSSPCSEPSRSTHGEGGGAPHDTEPSTPAIDGTIAAVRGLGDQPPQFIVSLWYESQAAGLDPDIVAAVMSFETGGTFSPTEQPPTNNAVGLLQWTKVGAAAQGTTIAQIATMSQMTQLRLAIERFKMFRPGSLVTVADYYMSVFAPAHVGRDDSTALYVDPSRAYRWNRLLDEDGDGTITKGEAAAHVIALLDAARLEPRIDVSLLVAP